MGADEPTSEQGSETPQELADRLTLEITALHGPKQVGQGELFNADKLDVALQAKIEAEKIADAIRVQQEAKARERAARLATQRAAVLAGKTTKERAAIKAQWLLDDVQANDDAKNAGQSVARTEETGKLATTLSSVEGDDLIRASLERLETESGDTSTDTLPVEAVDPLKGLSPKARRNIAESVAKNAARQQEHDRLDPANSVEAARRRLDEIIDPQK